MELLVNYQKISKRTYDASRFADNEEEAAYIRAIQKTRKSIDQAKGGRGKQSLPLFDAVDVERETILEFNIGHQNRSEITIIRESAELQYSWAGASLGREVEPYGISRASLIYSIPTTPPTPRLLREMMSPEDMRDFKELGKWIIFVVAMIATTYPLW